MLQIETERLVVCPLEVEDWRAVWVYTSDAGVMRCLPIGPFGHAQARRWVARWSDWRQRAADWPDMLVVILKAEARLICHLPFEVFSAEYRTREIGWVIDPVYRGQGYAAEGARAVLDLGFGRLNLPRVVATCDPDNVASCRIMEKLGMRYEAHFRQDVLLDGQWRDEYFYAIPEEE
jgi:RimJ/RimL family protein N-acetyltransferase